MVLLLFFVVAEGVGSGVALTGLKFNVSYVAVKYFVLYLPIPFVVLIATEHSYI